jgi:E3 ubiquitin-protein ligase MARCH6
MNDPQYATNTLEVGDVNGEPDTCRICRAEAVDGEPLFYPCKCSGSIKFVHQDCLMEWLSHSQKKHCELCKTPFRFTKLYSPNMPQSLPMHVFLRHFAIHTAKNLATYLRFCLVVMVWLVVLPWITRQLWRLLFWLSDGGWPTTRSPGTDVMRISNTANISEVVHGMAASLPGNGTSPATPLHAQPTSSASLVARFIEFLMPYSHTISPDLNGSYPLTLHFLVSYHSTCISY